MANATDEHALHRLGTDPQDVLPPQTRHKIHTSRYWNAALFGVNLATLVPISTTLHYLSSVEPNTNNPSPFLCTLLKLLQLAPEEPEIAEYLIQTDFKYSRVVAAFYVRLVFPPPLVYRLLEPLLSDYRKIVVAENSGISGVSDGKFGISYVDAVVDALLSETRVLGITLRRLPPRYILVETGQLSPRKPLV